MSEHIGIADSQASEAEELLSGVPFLNIGALFLPPVWGPGHGRWLTILWYPLWMFADNLFYAAYHAPSPLSIVLASLAFVLLLSFTFAFARLMQVHGLARALEQGKSKAEYLRAERRWAVACIAAGLVMLAAATYYNLVVRSGL